jgi:WD40 repeat protein
VHEPTPPLDHRALGVPAALAAVALRALHKEPSARFVDMAEMSRALLDAIGATPPPEPALDQEARRRLFEQSCEEARLRMAAHDLSGALAAARRAQSLEPSRTGIAVLIADIEGRLRTAAPAGDERTVAATGSGAVRTLGAAAYRELALFGEPPATQAMALSPVQELLASTGSDGAVRLWDLPTRARIATLRTDLHQRTGHEALALAVAFSPDGTLLATGHVDGGVRLWDIGRRQALPVRLRHDDVVGALAFSPDGATLATGSVDSNLRLWDVRAARAGDARRELFRQPAGITALAYAGGGAWILTAHGNRVLRLQDARTGRLVASLRGPEGVVNLLRISPSGTLAAAAGQDRSLRLFDLETRQQKAVLTGLKRPAGGLAFLADGLHLVSVQANAVDIWDLETAAPAATLWGRPEESFVGVAMAAGGQHLVVALADGRIRLWGPGSQGTLGPQ